MGAGFKLLSISIALFSLCVLAQENHDKASPKDTASKADTNRPYAPALGAKEKEVLAKRVRESQKLIPKQAEVLAAKLLDNIHSPKEIGSILEGPGGIIASLHDQVIAGEFYEDTKDLDLSAELTSLLAAEYMREEGKFSKALAKETLKNLAEKGDESDPRVKALIEMIKKFAKDGSYQERVFEGVAQHIIREKLDRTQCISCGDIDEGVKIPGAEGALEKDEFNYDRWFMKPDLKKLGQRESSQIRANPVEFNGRFVMLPDGTTAEFQYSKDGKKTPMLRNRPTDPWVEAPEVMPAMRNYYERMKDGNENWDPWFKGLSPGVQANVNRALNAPPQAGDPKVAAKAMAKRLSDNVQVVQAKAGAAEVLGQGDKRVSAAVQENSGTLFNRPESEQPRQVFDEQMKVLGLKDYVDYLGNHFNSGTEYGVRINWDKINSLWPSKPKEYARVLETLEAVQKVPQGYKPFKVLGHEIDPATGTRRVLAEGEKPNKGFCLWCNIANHPDSKTKLIEGLQVIRPQPQQVPQQYYAR